VEEAKADHAKLCQTSDSCHGLTTGRKQKRYGQWGQSVVGAAVPFARLLLCQDGSAAGWVIPGNTGLEQQKGGGGKEDGEGRRELH